METNLAKIQENLKLIDVTKLVAYTKKLEQVGSFNKMMAPVLMQDFILAMDLANTMYCNALKCDSRTDNALSVAKSIAFLDKATDFLREKGVKESAEARKWYVDQDPDVIAARELKAQSEAMVAFLRNKYTEFKIAYEAVKKIAYADSYQTPYEGM
jgi:hypothetical protein